MILLTIIADGYGTCKYFIFVDKSINGWEGWELFKVLIYLKERELAPIGGPLGYNYNLKKGLEMIDTSEVSIDYLQGSAIKQEINSHIKNIKSKRIRTVISIVKSIYTKGKTLYWGKHVAEIDLSVYDAIHFHTTYEMYMVRDSLKDYKGIIILTVHTPTKPAAEIMDHLSRFERTRMQWFYKKLDDIDDYAFKRANYFIFPCEESEEPYYNNWDKFAKIKAQNKDKFYYNPTGIAEKNVNESREIIRERYGIPQDAKVICYVGRHNTIKGYADLKELGSKILATNENIYFLIAGREEPIKGLQHDRWLEIGWTNDPGSIIKAADIFVLPNRETYFDLVMLEVLSLGQVVVATRTGGNRYFEKIHCEGVKLYNDIEEGVSSICELLALSEEEMSKLQKSSREAFTNMFRVELFAERYLKILLSIMKTQQE